MTAELVMERPASGLPGVEGTARPLRVVTADDTTDHTPDGATRSVQDLAIELGSLAAAIAAQTGRFLMVLAEFDARDGWTVWSGMTSTAHWLSWQCGMARVTAREHVRVARALVALPVTAAELGAGRLSYSKVRAITRVATRETEADLVAVAQAATADQLDRFCAGVRTGTSVDEVSDRHERRHLTHRFDPDGMMSMHARCSPEEGAVIIDLLHRVQRYLDRSAVPEDEDDHRLPGTGHGLIDALVLVCEQFELSSDDSGDGSGSESADAATSPSRASRRGEAVLHVTLDDLTRVRLSESPPVLPGQPETLIGPHLECGPVLHPHTARRLTCDTGVVLHIHDTAGDRHDISPDGTTPATVVTPSARPGRTIDLGRRWRTPNAALWRALWDRDGGCVFPACGRRRYVHGHHLVHWADGGPTDLDNMVLLCGAHHRALHEGGFEITRRRDGTLRVQDRDGETVPRVPAVPPPPARAGHQHTFPGTEPATQEPPPGHPLPLAATDGGPLNLGYAVNVALTNWQIRANRREQRRHRPSDGAAA
ncbi:HNH endonuclease signature motif containing protein [Ruania halotolerans]|uniref:HNH endonuclease signature motif containing protein n=1 Tax=Ruania halotolerans TaxID=2897773 RepID=UPI001E30E2FD|nr:HNH endonuclease signature motif containing protein [Ruania halotolerans]UFU05891.1 HNH endonuclease [Ruania halotolerans]